MISHFWVGGTDNSVASAENHTQQMQSVNQHFVVDHQRIAQFHDIPDDYIDAAVDLHLLFRHASVGVNISDGLNCLMNNFAGPRPNFCDRHLDPDETYYDEKYDRSNWDFELHNESNPNPGWWNKVDFFIDRVNGLAPGQYEVVAFKFGYVDGDTNSNIADHFFDAGSSFPNYTDIEALEAAHPDKTVVWWTMGLARAIGTQPSESLNDQMRAYAAANDVVLMDIADIVSHTPDGQPCFYNGHPAMCEDYTTEQFGGHLNSRGMLYMAKAYWVLMAYLAGWQPDDLPPTATPGSTATATPGSTATATPSSTATATPGPTATATPGSTTTATPGSTATATPGPTATATSSATFTPMPTSTAVNATVTATPIMPTATPTPSIPEDAFVLYIPLVANP